MMNKERFVEIIRGSTRINTIRRHGIDEVINTLPTTPGIYRIFTSIPIVTLKEEVPREDNKHVDIGGRVRDIETLPFSPVEQVGSDFYCVYNGQARNLRRRFTEHFRGNSGSAVMQLDCFEDLLWEFEYYDLSSVAGGDSKLFRTYLEQGIRSVMGGAILCEE